MAANIEHPIPQKNDDVSSASLQLDSSLEKKGSRFKSAPKLIRLPGESDRRFNARVLNHQLSLVQKESLLSVDENFVGLQNETDITGFRKKLIHEERQSIYGVKANFPVGRG